MKRHGSIKRLTIQSQKKKEINSDKDIYSTDEEDRLGELNQEVDQLMEDVFGVPLVHTCSSSCIVTLISTFVLNPM